MADLRQAAQQALEALEFMADEWGFTQKANRPERWQAIDALRAALAQQEQATVKESLPVGQEEPEGGWQSAPSPQVTQRIADMPMSEYRRGVNDGFKLGLREGRIKAEDEMREQPEQEPVAYSVQSPDDAKRNRITPSLVTDTRLELEEYLGNSETAKHIVPLYTHPPRREWQSLSEGEVASCWAKGFEACKDQTVGDLRMHIARAVEAALKEKNQ
jgi:hypothetical protein